jgi:hypothetical protein
VASGERRRARPAGAGLAEAGFTRSSLLLLAVLLVVAAGSAVVILTR